MNQTILNDDERQIALNLIHLNKDCINSNSEFVPLSEEERNLYIKLGGKDIDSTFLKPKAL